jgi:hypothetical protein
MESSLLLSRTPVQLARTLAGYTGHQQRRATFSRRRCDDDVELAKASAGLWANTVLAVEITRSAGIELASSLRV